MNVNDYEHRRASKADLKDTINLPIAIPVWGVLMLLASGLYFGGTTVQKLNTVIENSAKTELRVATISDKQVDSIADMKMLQKSVAQLEVRVVAIELRAARK